MKIFLNLETAKVNEENKAVKPKEPRRRSNPKVC